MVKLWGNHPHCLEWSRRALVFSETFFCFSYSAEGFVGIYLHSLLNISYRFLIFPLFYSLKKNEAAGNGPIVPQIKVLHLRFKPKSAELRGPCRFHKRLSGWGWFCGNLSLVPLQCFGSRFWEDPELICFLIMDSIEYHLYIAKEVLFMLYVCAVR